MKLRLEESGVAAEKPRTIMELFQTTLELYGSHPALAVKRGGTWLSWTYKDYYDDCLTAAKGFIEVYRNEKVARTLLIHNSLFTFPMLDVCFLFLRV